MTPLILCVILDRMVGAESNTNVIQVLVNYWEIRPSQMQQHLSGLLQKGITEVTSFVPWQAVESDISHLLSKFLLSSFELGIRVSLIITPEVGVYYPGGGLPKDLMANPANLARNSKGKPFSVVLPPAVFALPSLFSPEVQDRYQQFLIRLDSLLSDLSKAEPGILGKIRLVMTGSYWKYYREPASAKAGEYSLAASAAFRTEVNQRYTTREFEMSEGGASRWKTQTLEQMNQKWFLDQAEDRFRARFEQFLKKRRSQADIQQIELYTPEADPARCHTQILQMISDLPARAEELDAWVDEWVVKDVTYASKKIPALIHWSGLGVFKSLTDSEKQYLLLKSIFLTGIRGGGVLIEEKEWLSLPQSFRARAESIGRTMARRELKPQNRIHYLAAHQWSGPTSLQAAVSRVAGVDLHNCTSFDSVAASPQSRLCIVDPEVVMTKELFLQMLEWIQQGRVLAIPHSPLYTEFARRILEEALARDKRMELNLGVPYVLQSFQNAGNGKLVVYSSPETASPDETQSAWMTFAEAMVSIADARPFCALADESHAQLVVTHQGVLIFNPTGAAVDVELSFDEPMSVSDFSWFFMREKKTRPEETARVGTSFTLGIPARGVVPLQMVEERLHGAQAGLESI
mgnify:CR=1 FL=1